MMHFSHKILELAFVVLLEFGRIYHYNRMHSNDILHHSFIVPLLLQHSNSVSICYIAIWPWVYVFNRNTAVVFQNQNNNNYSRIKLRRSFPLFCFCIDSRDAAISTGTIHFRLEPEMEHNEKWTHGKMLNLKSYHKCTYSNIDNSITNTKEYF